MDVSTIRWNTESGWCPPPGLDSESTLVLIFGDRSLAEDEGPLRALLAAFPTSTVVGCSSSGHIVGAELVDGAPVAAIARFDQVRLEKVSADVHGGDDSGRLGAELGARLAGDDLRAVFVLSDGLSVNGSALVSGIAGEVSPDVVISGGLAGDGDRFESTWVIDDGERHANRVVAVGLYGASLHVSTGSAGGWGIFGPARVVTRSRGNVLYELDGLPALELYRRYLGDLAAGLPASALLFPLAVRPVAGTDQVVRTVLAIDEEQQSMTFAGDVPEGWQAQLMRSSPDRLVDGASVAGELSVDGDATGPSLNIAISCVGRRLVLGQRTEEEIDATLDALRPDAELIGFYSYGEIAPGTNGIADLHNQTMTVTSLSEVSV